MLVSPSHREAAEVELRDVGSSAAVQGAFSTPLPDSAGPPELVGQPSPQQDAGLDLPSLNECVPCVCTQPRVVVAGMRIGRRFALTRLHSQQLQHRRLATAHARRAYAAAHEQPGEHALLCRPLPSALKGLACLQAYAVTSLNALVLFLSCTCFLMETMPELKQCAERPRRSSGADR